MHGDSAFIFHLLLKVACSTTLCFTSIGVISFNGTEIRLNKAKIQAKQENQLIVQ
jgi:hypothetical protein